MEKIVLIENISIINQLESLDFEVKSRADLLSYMVMSNVPTDNASFVSYHEEYQKFFVKFQQAKQSFEDTYVRPLIVSGERCNWRVDYDTQELHLEVESNEEN